MDRKTLGRYQIEAEIGRGAIGVVYRALDPVLERTVAIKTLHPNLPDDIVTEMRARFVREAKSAGRLNHPNIVTIYDAGMEGDIAYIAMEYLEGRSLQQLMKARGALPIDMSADIAAQVAEGLDYAGRFGIVHRDIKPANIMVSVDGVAKITDFGVAHLPSSSMTHSGSVLGTPKYIAPEQIQEQQIDPRADIFSLGIVLHEMLAGRHPFEVPGADVFALMDRLANVPPPAVSAQRPDVPAALDAIVARALAKQPAERFQRAGDLAEQLRALALPAGADFHVDAEPSGELPYLHSSLSKLLADLETFSRSQAASAQAANELSLQLRKAFHYLEELARRVIEANPPFAVRLDLIYLGALPTARLTEGRVECAMTQVGDSEVVDCVTLYYRMASQRKARIALSREEAVLLKRHLSRAQLSFDSREVKDHTGAVRCEAFLIEVDLVAQATLRGDYERQTVEIACENVGVLGPAAYRLPAAEFDEAIWEFGQLLLNLPSRFAGLRLPGA